MNRKKYSLSLILLAVTPLLFTSCNSCQSPQEPIHDTIIVYSAPEEAPGMDIPMPDEPVAQQTVAKQAARQAATRKAAQAKQEEVLSIAGHGANGRVWGHIIMNGDKGRGTVTDEHENALAVTCTRRGEELICYDQNSRQYIFRL